MKLQDNILFLSVKNKQTHVHFYLGIIQSKDIFDFVAVGDQFNGVGSIPT